MRIFAENEYLQIGVGEQKNRFVMHQKQCGDGRMSLAIDFAKAALHGTGGGWTPDLVREACDLAELFYAEWERRGWSLPMPSLTEEDEKVIGIGR